MSAKALVCPPELGPAFAGRPADEDVWAVIALFIVDAERVAVMPRQPARRELGIQPTLRPPNDDERRGLPHRIGPQIKRIGQADGRRQMVCRAKILNHSHEYAAVTTRAQRRGSKTFERSAWRLLPALASGHSCTLHARS